LLLWAVEHGFDVEADDFSCGCWFAAIGTGSLDMVMWFDHLLDQLQRGFEADGHALQHAMQCGYVDICRYLHASGCEWEYDTVECAALSDKPEVCEWLLEVNYPLDLDELAENGAYFGKLAVLQGHCSVVLNCKLVCLTVPLKVAVWQSCNSLSHKAATGLHATSTPALRWAAA
jgi:hypothetical protein